jgi:crotonobetainyl-CoA:carnitine CoA-transferase CaiB-like acyl-CoA transferase
VNDKPFNGIKVVELSSFVAAPSCTRILADWGAEVIKIETLGGDIWRYFGPGVKVAATEEENPLFDVYNANKKSIALDLKAAEGVAVLHKLLAACDVFVTSNRPAALRKMGLDYDSLKGEFPRLVYALMTGYGEKGPDCDSPGYDSAVFWARSGLMADLMTPGAYPVAASIAIGDTACGTALFGGICAALYNREKTGKGDKVSISLFGAAVWFMASMAIVSQDRYGYPYPKKRAEVSPVGTYYKCKDEEWIMLTIMDYDRQFPIMCELCGLKFHERFKSKVDMLECRVEVIKAFENAFMEKNSDEWSKLLKEKEIVHEKLGHFKDLCKDPQALANGYVRKVGFASGGKINQPFPPIESERLGTTEYSKHPLLGENSSEILRGLGYSEAEISALKEKKVVKGK